MARACDHVGECGTWCHNYTKRIERCDNCQMPTSEHPTSDDKGCIAALGKAVRCLRESILGTGGHRF